MDFSLLFVLALSAVPLSQAADCCSAYTDPSGTYHESELCEDYCCWQLSLTRYKECCSNPLRQVPASDRDNEECMKSWISEHVWVPIVGGILFLIIIVGICTCCCCCACCTCCRKSPQPVVIHTAGSYPGTTTVAMSNQTVMNQNPLHYGYEQ